ncbi:MAG: carboxypeptidase-like regulatory domain-containing protein [Methylococcales bacterium]
MQSLALIPKKLVLTLSFVFISLSTAFGQEMDVESNNTCPAAQEIGTVTLPFTLDGILDPADVDFFRLALTPDSRVRIDLEGETTGNGTLADPFVGVFDSACNLIALDDDGSGSLNSRLTFTVPADGVFVLAASSCCDDAFVGAGGSDGTYQLSVTLGPPSAGPISGRVVDTDTGEPLPGDSPPFASVELNRCNSDGECSEFVNFQSTDVEGRFRFEIDFNGNDLTAGTYQLNALADQFESTQTEIFELGAGEDLEVSDIKLIPPPIQFNNIQPCDNLPRRGGTCDYSATISNRTSTQFRGTVWSIVNASGTGGFNDFTTFQTGKSGTNNPRPQQVKIAPGRSRVVNFKFEVPFTVASGASICADVYAAQGRKNAQFDTVAQQFLFCIEKDSASGLRTMSAGEARKQFREKFKRSMRRSR